MAHFIICLTLLEGLIQPTVVRVGFLAKIRTSFSQIQTDLVYLFYSAENISTSITTPEVVSIVKYFTFTSIRFNSAAWICECSTEIAYLTATDENGNVYVYFVTLVFPVLCLQSYILL